MSATNRPPAQNTFRMTTSACLTPLPLIRGQKIAPLEYLTDRKLEDRFPFIRIGIQINPVRGAEGAKG